jgi:hypothetical protein
MRVLYITVILALAMGNLMAATLYVPDTLNDPPQWTTIQGAIAATSDGDTIIVADGTYYENINFNGMAITIESANGPAGCVIDGSQIRAVVQFVSNEQTDSVLDGFQITNGVGELYEDVIWDYYLGGGIFCYWSGPTIKNCWIHGNDPRSQSNFSEGGGIYIGWMGTENDGSRAKINPVIDSCKIYDNEVYGAGGGIYCDLTEPGWPTTPLLDESITITNCEIYNNEDAQIGGGVAIWRGGFGNAVYFDYNIVYGNTINTTVGSTEDAAVDIYLCVPYVRNNLIYDNEHGGLLILQPYANPTVTCNTIADNNDYAVKYKYIYFPSVCAAYNNIFWDNGDYEVIIDETDNETFTFDYNDIKGGSGGIDDNGTGNTVNYYGNNINSDPLYNTTYHIPTNSPCKNAGSNTYIDPPYYDIDGQDRNNGTVDMGADEYWYRSG